MSSVSRTARLLELQALNALQKLELQKLNKAVDRRNKRIQGLRKLLDAYQEEREFRAEVRSIAASSADVLAELAN